MKVFPTVLEECFQAPVEGAIYAEIIDRLRACGAIRSAKLAIRPVDCSAPSSSV